jgi:hypothetical protein
MSTRLRMTQVTGFCLTAGAFLALAAQAQRQTTPPRAGSQSPTGDDQTQVARPVSVEVPAVNYFAQGRETKVEFSPTPLMPGARGQGRVKVLTEGSTSVKVQFTGLKDATTFGNEFLTYILWGSIPKGRTLKISELALKGDRWEAVATTALHTFAMMVTAEPYAAVTQPSSIVVLKGASATNDTIQTASAQIELLGDAYAPPGHSYEPLDTSSGYAPAFIQAMNARRIAKAFHAENYAPQEFEAAEDHYQYMIRKVIQEKKASKHLLRVANNVAEIFEKARIISVRRQQNGK